MAEKERLLSPQQEKLHEIIFEADTPEGRWFDIILMVAIIASVVIVMLETVKELNDKYHTLFVTIEWFLTILFTIEYVLRLYCVRSKLRYATSFFGVIDLVSIIPTYISLFLAGTQYFLVIRALRLLRVFRVLKLGNYLKESRVIVESMKASRNKIFVFLFFVVIMVIIIGSVMYLIEGGENSDFTSIPRSVYWAIVTLTTVGYGDISPQTDLGQFLSAIVMILGYAVIAVPTGIVSAELVNKTYSTNTQACRNCGLDGHDDDAEHCKYCGEILNE